MRKLLSVILFIFLLSNAARSQDPHFSQYFASPMTLNPAMTGYFEGDHRLSTNFRQQWNAVSSPYLTNTLSYDTKIMAGKIPENDVLGVGILGLYDQSLEGGFKSVNVSASLSYRKAFDEDGINNLGIGFQFTYASRAIDFNRLDFANQFNGFGFNTALPSYETFDNSRESYVDLNAGLLYIHKTENAEVYLGGSLYHINRPNTSFLKGEKFLLPMRFTVHAGSRFTVGYNNNEIYVGGLYMQQAKATEKTIGLLYGLNLKEVVKLYFGSWYRFNDAIIPYIGLDHKGFNIGISYDINNSGLKDHNPKNSSFEISLNVPISRPQNVYTNYKGKMF